ncbi:LysR family transcriptional regulator [Streptomyces candidus]|uniref:DNA-binding transcriptional LysR family regulator n=1 Tax=Streptomyces candidus TaxID=67283 RepID=A0A7X0LQA5_9ACTN|nr:LysR family transcriptional regulator [Streptomyces candidus]MBB6435721.1 DNA-binding transcriptional LysR family regulator [Streptomyces candidus]GHH46386.1 transcriptional regulator [Streptomyces candidus]
MELRHLRHFVALAEERSFTRAAARELIVQSGLSSSVRGLEKEVGALLFVRGTRPVRLTTEGEALLPAARRTLDAADTALQAVRGVHGGLTGRLRIGAYQASRHLVPLAAWLSCFVREHPGLDIEVRQFPATEMISMVADGELDCALAAAPDRAKTAALLDVVELVTEPFVLACPSDHPLAAHDEVPLPLLDGERFVETHSRWTGRLLTDAYFAEAGLTRRIVCEVSEWAMVSDLVAAGLGVAFVPASLSRDLLPLPDLPLRFLPLTGNTTSVRLERRVDLLLPRGQGLNTATRMFAEHVQREVRSARRQAG